MSQNTLPHWCPEASRKGTFGRCLQGIRRRQEEVRALDCEDCRALHQAEIDRKPLEEVSERGLGGGRKTGVTAGGKDDGNGRGQDHKVVDGGANDVDGDDDGSAAVYVW